MKTRISLRKIELSDEQKQMLVKKIDKLGKFFNDEAQADIVVGSQREKKIVEVTIRTANMIYRAEERSDEVYNAADEIVESIERQIRKNKTRLAKQLKTGIKPEFYEEKTEEAESEIKIVKTKTHHVKPMNAEEAVLQMNMLGHAFFVFLDSETNCTSIVYRRKDGNYGLIETD